MPSSNEFFVDHVQNPFGDRVKSILDGLQSKRDAGTLTYEDVQGAQQSLQNEVDLLGKAQTDYSALGGAQAATVAGSKQTLDPLISQWQGDLSTELGTLQPAKKSDQADLSPDAPTLQTILGGGNASDTADAAAGTVKSKMADSGALSTILTNPQGFVNSPTAPRRTLLGY